MFTLLLVRERYWECELLIISYHLYFLRVSVKFGACYITGQWDKFRVKNATLGLHILFGIFCCFLSTNLCFYNFHFFS